jgi:hypothetical protein
MDSSTALAEMEAARQQAEADRQDAAAAAARLAEATREAQQQTHNR